MYQVLNWDDGSGAVPSASPLANRWTSGAGSFALGESSVWHHGTAAAASFRTTTLFFLLPAQSNGHTAPLLLFGFSSSSSSSLGTACGPRFAECARDGSAGRRRRRPRPFFRLQREWQQQQQKQQPGSDLDEIDFTAVDVDVGGADRCTPKMMETVGFGFFSSFRESEQRRKNNAETVAASFRARLLQMVRPGFGYNPVGRIGEPVRRRERMRVANNECDPLVSADFCTAWRFFSVVFAVAGRCGVFFFVFLALHESRWLVGSVSLFSVSSFLVFGCFSRRNRSRDVGNEGCVLCVCLYRNSR